MKDLTLTCTTTKNGKPFTSMPAFVYHNIEGPALAYVQSQLEAATHKIKAMGRSPVPSGEDAYTVTLSAAGPLSGQPTTYGNLDVEEFHAVERMILMLMLGMVEDSLQGHRQKKAARK